ncbi:MAG TPA: hypothetical protein VIU64_00940 [Polyangia bacterium]
MDDPAQTNPRSSPASPVGEGPDDEFADIPSPRTRHPVLALAAGVLALFLVIKMRGDLSFFFAPRTPADLGDARALMANPNATRVLEDGVNRLVRVTGTPDRESALQVDTKGSWTFTQFFRLFGTQSRLFVHRREDPLPAFRAESDAFEGRLIRFSDLPFEEAIRSYFANHVGATHFFRPDDLRRVVAAGVTPTVSLTDLAGDVVVLGPNDLLAFEVKHAGQVEVRLPLARFPKRDAASEAIEKRGGRVVGPGRAVPDRQTFIIEVTDAERDRVLNDVAAIDYQSELRDVRETIKGRLGDLAIDRGQGGGERGGQGGNLIIKAGTADPGAPGAAPGPSGPRVLTGIVSVRTLATVQIPPDAYLIVEAETPRDHLSDAAIAAVLVAFAGVNLAGLAKVLAARRALDRSSQRKA